jgi:hypothetical protein
MPFNSLCYLRVLCVSVVSLNAPLTQFQTDPLRERNISCLLFHIRLESLIRTAHQRCSRLDFVPARHKRVVLHGSIISLNSIPVTTTFALNR